MIPSEARHTPRPSGGNSVDLSALARCVRDEARHVRDLAEVLILQRAAVSSADTDSVNVGTEGIHQALLQLNDARAARGRCVADLTGDADVPLAGLGERLGIPLSPDLEAARLELLDAAKDVSRELAINRTVLRRVLDTGDSFFRKVFDSVSRNSPQYARAETRPSPSILVNKVI